MRSLRLLAVLLLETVLATRSDAQTLYRSTGEPLQVARWTHSSPSAGEVFSLWLHDAATGSRLGTVYEMSVGPSGAVLGYPWGLTYGGLAAGQLVYFVSDWDGVVVRDASLTMPIPGGYRVRMQAAPGGHLTELLVFGVDEITVTPEPGTFALVGTALATLGVVALRRRRRAA